MTTPSPSPSPSGAAEVGGGAAQAGASGAAAGDSGAAPQEVTITLDGREVAARPGELLIAAAERAGVYIPRFCYHPRMRQVGMCRMCLVEVKGPRGFSLQPACFQPVANGMEVRTESPAVKKAQDGVLEFLLVNHPLDCPVCDKGGECPLQDQTLTFGPGETRFVEEKRHWSKPIPVSSLVELDRERCIQCDRCTRFAKEVAGDPFITFQGRGDHTEVNTFPDRPFASYFSGNTVQICPVGALTASAYRFKARPWDLEQVESTCTTCALGCRMVVQSSSGEVVRHLGVDDEAVNHSWLCDKGRFAFEASTAPSRRTHPLLRSDARLRPVSWQVALSEVAGRLRAVLATDGPGAVGVLGGARLTNEDAYAWAKLAKAVIGTDSVDAQLDDGLPAELVAGLPPATIADACAAKVLLFLGPDPREELPVLFLRLRGAVRDHGLDLVELSPVDTSLTDLARASLRYRPGQLVDLVRQLLGSLPPANPAVAAARDRLVAGGGEGVVVALGRSSIAESEEQTVAAAGLLRRMLPGATFLPLLRRGNVRGALDAGLAPGLLPGRQRLADGGAFATAWGGLPGAPGRGARALLEAAATGQVRALFLLGADPLSDFPDRSLARRALEAVELVVSVEAHPNASSEHVDVVLPAAAPSERAGTTTNCEGRLSPVGQKVVAPGLAWPDWAIAVELAAALGADLGFASPADIVAERARLAPLFAGVTSAVLAGTVGRMGALLPLRGRGPDGELGEWPAGATGGLERLDPMAVPGIASVESQGAPSEAGVVRAAGPVVAAPVGGRMAAGDDGPAALLSWEPPEALPATPPVDAYSLRLVAARRCYDGGTAVQASPSLAALAASPALRAHPSELERLGVASGTKVAVRAAPGRLELVLEADAGVPKGVAVLGAVPPAADAPGASALVRAGDPVTEIRLETLEAG